MKRIKSSLALTGLAGACPAVPATAQHKAAGRHFILNLDLDRTGRVFFGELARERGVAFCMLDANEDGCLNAGEYTRFDDLRTADMTHIPGRKRGIRSVGRSMTRDFNAAEHDGAVALAGVLNRVPAWSEISDRNADGSVISDDFGPV